MSSVAVSPSFSSPKEVADRTGLSPRTIRRHYSSGRLRAYKFGGRILLDLREVESLIRSSPRESATITPPALDADGRAVVFTPAEARGRVGAALAALGEAQEGGVDAEQVAGWDMLRTALADNRGEG